MELISLKAKQKTEAILRAAALRGVVMGIDVVRCMYWFNESIGRTAQIEVMWMNALTEVNF